jgi:hypothetical protein
MGIARRVIFAAPFVVVIGCHKPVADSVSADDKLPTGPAVMPRSSMPEPPPDAAIDPVDAADKPAVVSDCADPRTRPRCTSNPPPPDAMNSPKSVHLRVIRIEVQRNASIATLGGGSDQGITKDWTGCFVKDASSDTCRGGGDLVIIRLEPRSTIVKSTATHDQIENTPFVKLWPR